jgi:hypothetical protein
MDRVDNSCGDYDGNSILLISCLANLMKSNLKIDLEAIKMFVNLYISMSLFIEGN